MVQVRLTYDRDIRRHGTEVIDVTPQAAEGIVRLRRGVILDDAPPQSAAKNVRAKKAAAPRKRTARKSRN